MICCFTWKYAWVSADFYSVQPTKFPSTEEDGKLWNYDKPHWCDHSLSLDAMKTLRNTSSVLFDQLDISIYCVKIDSCFPDRNIQSHLRESGRFSRIWVPPDFRRIKLTYKIQPFHLLECGSLIVFELINPTKVILYIIRNSNHSIILLQQFPDGIS